MPGTIGWNSDLGMDVYCGRDATVTEVFKNRGVLLDIDDGKWVWAFDWLLPV